MKHTQVLAAALLAGGLSLGASGLAHADAWGHRYRHDSRPRHEYRYHKHHRHVPVVYVPVRYRPISFRERAHAQYHARAHNLPDFYLHVSDRGTAFGIAVGR